MKPNSCISSAQIDELLNEQRDSWPLAQANYAALADVQTKQLDLGGICVIVQHNPSRITSTGAKTDKQSIQKRACFLCAANLPQEQTRLPFGEAYDILCNPYPIFREHFTIPSRQHEDQRIYNRLADMLDLAYELDKHTIFYNGPRSGASAPDHAHFQAVTRGQMPIEEEVSTLRQTHCEEVLATTGATLLSLTRYHRNGFVIEATERDEAIHLFQLAYNTLEQKPEEPEPGMNLFAWYTHEQWQLVLLPRHRHRPWQYEATGEMHLLSSPGAADMGGLFITPRKEDFEKITPAIVQDIYEQVGYADPEIMKLSAQIRAKHKSNSKL